MVTESEQTRGGGYPIFSSSLDLIIVNRVPEVLYRPVLGPNRPDQQYVDRSALPDTPQTSVRRDLPGLDTQSNAASQRPNQPHTPLFGNNSTDINIVVSKQTATQTLGDHSISGNIIDVLFNE